MRRLRRKIRKLKADKGVSLPIVAMSLTVLLGVSAFAVDLGWFYLNATRVQRAADSAALAGVVHMPANFEQAEIDARELARINGYDHDEPQVSVGVSAVPDNEHQLEVRVEDTVQTFFLRVLGRQTQTIARKARAQFVPPLPMGSPENQFGDSPGCWPGTPAPQGPCNNFWASIQGHRNGQGWGDYFSSLCRNWGTGASCTGDGGGGVSPDYRPRGYLYGIDVPAGTTSFTVQLLNPAFRPLGNGNVNPMEERFIQGSGWSAGVGAPQVRFTLYNQTSTPLVLDSTSPIGGSCTQTYDPEPWPGNTNVNWQTHCTVNNPTPGIYPLQVQIPSSNTRGHARFSILATGSGAGTNPSVFALGDMSIYAATEGTTEFFLAEVLPIHAGKALVIELWDAGDASGQGSNDPELRVIGAGGSSVDCTFTSTRPGESTPTFLPNCAKVTSFGGNTNDTCSNCYNNHWMRFRIELPSDYDCTDCWWKMRYTYPPGTSVTDTTTWRAFIEGNPVHLVPAE